MPTREKVRTLLLTAVRPLIVRVELAPVAGMEVGLNMQVAGDAPIHARATLPEGLTTPGALLALMVSWAESVCFVTRIGFAPAVNLKSAVPDPLRAMRRGLPGPLSEIVSVPD